jgi:hypothetical protein
MPLDLKIINRQPARTQAEGTVKAKGLGQEQFDVKEQMRRCGE